MSYESSVNKLLELAGDYKTKDKDTLRISFEETCDVVTNITRIDDYTTWFMNAEECTDIARAIRWKYIVNYIWVIDNDTFHNSIPISDI